MFRFTPAHYLRLAIAFIISTIITSCCSDDEINAAMFTGRSTVYSLASSDTDVHGFIKFSERRDNETLILIYLEGTRSGDWHPAFIRSDSVDYEAIELNHVQRKNGISETLVKQNNNNFFLTYDQLLKLQGEVTIHLSESQMETILARGEIGN